MSDAQPITDLAALTAAPLCAVFRRFLKSRSLKYTPERAGVLDAIIESGGAFEVDDLLDELRGAGHRVSKATVYRTIRLLQEAGIVTPAAFDPRGSRYELVYGGDDHDIMVCVRTGRRVPIEAPELAALRERLAREQGWQAFAHRFHVFAVSPEG